MQKSRRYVLIKVFHTSDYLGIVLVSLLVAVVLFPKGKLEELLPQSTDINLDLSIAYYQALLKTSPSKEIYDAIVQSYLRAGKFKEALNLVQIFQKTHPNDPEALWLKYQLLKGEYFYQKDEVQRSKMRSKMEDLLLEYLKFKADENALLKVFREGESMYIPKVAYKASLDLAETKKDTQWVKKAYYYSISFRDYQKAHDLLKVLLDREEVRWLSDAINVAMLTGNTQDAILYVSKFYKDLSTPERLRLVQKLIDVGMTDKNYLTFREDILEKLALSREERLYLEKETMKRAMWSKDYETLKSLILKNLYLDERLEYKVFILELALATGDPNFARYVAEKVHFGGRF